VNTITRSSGMCLRVVFEVEKFSRPGKTRQSRSILPLLLSVLPIEIFNTESDNCPKQFRKYYQPYPDFTRRESFISLHLQAFGSAASG
jgi:hypothetical protein